MERVEARGHSVEERHLMVEAFSPETEKAFAQMVCGNSNTNGPCTCDGE